ncbi:MAG: phosphate/phosphite/phosphonate ABC transporter substrate-binding protein [Pirellulales bacterium]
MTNTFSVKRVALVIAPLAIASVAIVSIMASRIESEAKRKGEESMLSWFEMTSPTPRLMDPRFTDADTDLVADTPANAEQQISPDVLVFSYVAGPEAADEQEAWKDFVTHLENATGKKVELATFSTTDEQLSALAQGKLHVAAFNTGAVPLAVASCGFVPICTPGKGDGTFGTTMRVIVPAKSPVKSVKDLKGRTIAFTTRDSNSGCKAALAMLREYDLLPLRDYQWKFSGSHDASIAGVAKGEYQAAPVASDLLDRAIAAGTIQKDQVRIIYESEHFPPATIGYVYFLPKELSDKIRTAFIDYPWSGTNVQKQFESAGASKFVPVSYKRDFALIRRIDDAFRKTSN